MQVNSLKVILGDFWYKSVFLISRRVVLNLVEDAFAMWIKRVFSFLCARYDQFVNSANYGVKVFWKQ
jgi:hypothetical protein